MKIMNSQLSKQYRRDFWGLRDFDLELGSGVIGLLGRNGAGQSTLMRMLATFTQPTEGTVKWNGTDIIFLYGMWGFTVLSALLIGDGVAFGMLLPFAFTAGGWFTGAVLKKVDLST